MVISACRAYDLPYDGTIEGVQTTPERIDEEFLGNGLNNLIGTAEQYVPKPAGTSKGGRTIGENGRGVDEVPGVDGAPSADGIEILQREAQRVHWGVARRAGRVLAMQGEALAYRTRSTCFVFPR